MFPVCFPEDPSDFFFLVYFCWVYNQKYKIKKEQKKRFCKVHFFLELYEVDGRKRGEEVTISLIFWLLIFYCWKGRYVWTVSCHLPCHLLNFISLFVLLRILIDFFSFPSPIRYQQPCWEWDLKYL